MRTLKTWRLGSTRSQEDRLLNLALLNIHRDIELDLDRVIERFAKDRKHEQILYCQLKDMYIHTYSLNIILFSINSVNICLLNPPSPSRSSEALPQTRVLDPPLWDNSASCMPTIIHDWTKMPFRSTPHPSYIPEKSCLPLVFPLSQTPTTSLFISPLQERARANATAPQIPQRKQSRDRNQGRVINRPPCSSKKQPTRKQKKNSNADSPNRWNTEPRVHSGSRGQANPRARERASEQAKCSAATLKSPADERAESCRVQAANSIKLSAETMGGLVAQPPVESSGKILLCRGEKLRRRCTAAIRWLSLSAEVFVVYILYRVRAPERAWIEEEREQQTKCVAGNWNCRGKIRVA